MNPKKTVTLYGGVIVVFMFFMTTAILYFCYYSKRCRHDKKNAIAALIRQTARWTVASQQDKSPMIALLHANYGAGYLQALELIATENEINQFENLQLLRQKVYGTQDKAAKKVIQTCPNYIGPDMDRELALVGINIGS